MLTTTEGFRRVVHSIGVSVEMDAHDKTVEFVFQMYGKSVFPVRQLSAGPR